MYKKIFKKCSYVIDKYFHEKTLIQSKVQLKRVIETLQSITKIVKLFTLLIYIDIIVALHVLYFYSNSKILISKIQQIFSLFFIQNSFI